MNGLSLDEIIDWNPTEDLTISDLEDQDIE